MARNNRRIYTENGATQETNKFNKSMSAMERLSDEKLQYWLSKFVLEVRKEDCTEYPPKTLLSLLMGLQSHITTETKRKVDVLNSAEFFSFKQVLDAELKRLAQKGLGITVNKA